MSTQALWQPWWAMLIRELTSSIRQRAQWANPLMFFVVVIALFPLALSPSPALLKSVAPAIIWVAALLAVLSGLEGLFRSDYDDGSLEQMLLSSVPFGWLVSAKITAHWLVSCLPLLVLSPLLGGMLSLSSLQIGVLMLGLALGTPCLCLMGAIGAGLTVSLSRGGVLLSLVMLPLYVPVLIFGAGMVNMAEQGFSVLGQVAILGAILMIALPLAPWITGIALRMALHE